MKLKMLSVAALALTLACGVASAQNNDDSGSTPAVNPEVGGADTGDATRSISGPSDTTASDEMMKPFYMEDGKTIRPVEDLTAAFNAMSDEDKAKVKSECAATESPRAELCESLKNVM